MLHFKKHKQRRERERKEREKKIVAFFSWRKSHFHSCKPLSLSLMSRLIASHVVNHFLCLSKVVFIVKGDSFFNLRNCFLLSSLIIWVLPACLLFLINFGFWVLYFLIRVSVVFGFNLHYCICVSFCFHWSFCGLVFWIYALKKENLSCLWNSWIKVPPFTIC